MKSALYLVTVWLAFTAYVALTLILAPILKLVRLIRRK